MALLLLAIGAALSGFFAWVCFSIAMAPGSYEERAPVGFFFGFFFAIVVTAGFLEAFAKILIASLTAKRFEKLLSRSLWYAILVGAVAFLVSTGVGALQAGDILALSLVVAMLGGLAFTVTKVRSVLARSSLETHVTSGMAKPSGFGPLPPIPAWFRNGTATADGVRAYVPNQIDLRTRIFHTVSSLYLLAYGAYGLWMDDLFLPGKRGRGIHLHGAAALTMFFAMLAACVVMSSSVVDHYDRRDNESVYRRVARYAEFVGWSLMFAAVLLEISKR